MSRNSGFLPPLAADGVYDHNCAVPSTVRHAGRAQERPAREVSASLLSKKNVPIQPWLTWLSLLALGSRNGSLTPTRVCRECDFVSRLALRAVLRCSKHVLRPLSVREYCPLLLTPLALRAQPRNRSPRQHRLHPRSFLHVVAR